MSDDLSSGTWRREPGTVIRHAESPTGDSASLTIFAESETTGVATDWPAHSHPMHELVWVRGGTLTTRIGTPRVRPAEHVHRGVPPGDARYSGTLGVRNPVFDVLSAGLPKRKIVI